MPDQTYFDVPTAPEAFGIQLTPSNLRKIDFSGLDFDASRKAIFEYIQTYFPDQFNDFVASNGIIMLVEIVASIVSKLSLRSDLLAQEATLPTAQTEQAVINHLALINQRVRNATPATTSVEVSLISSAYTDVVIPAGIKLTTAGPNNTVITYEIYKSPNDYTSDITIPAGKRGVIAFGIEGQRVVSPVTISPGGPSQMINISDVNILDSPIDVEIIYGDSSKMYDVIFEPIERYGPNDQVVQATISSTGLTLLFGDDIAGKAPIVGSQIVVTYRVGGGLRGKIGAFVFDTTRQYRPQPPASAPVSVRFRNISPSSGGSDRESLEAAKRRAPLDYAVQGAITTAADYAQSAKSFSHPAFGNVSKALATVRTGYNANIVDLYILCDGGSVPIAPSAGMVLALGTHIRQYNVMTDTIEISSGFIKPVDIEMNVVLNRNADAAVVKSKVETAVTNFFDLTSFEMGQALYVSNFVDMIQAIDGILYVDILKPLNNILPSNKIVSTTEGTLPNLVGLNELITAGSRKISYYYEKTS